MKRLFSAVACTAITLAALAVPANPRPATVQQADGTSITLKLVGDEYYNYTATSDGYVVVRNDAGNYVYAMTQGDDVVPSNVVAHDAAQRSSSEQAYVAASAMRSLPAARAEHAHQARVKRDLQGKGIFNTANFRGLVILVNYTDVQFSQEDPQAFYDELVNGHDYTGFTDANGRKQSVTGSMRDYYYANSLGKFDPVFDVVGPITVDYASTYPQGTSYARAVFGNALYKANSQIDYTQYDGDGDGKVDMVYFIVAGYGSNVSGNDDDLLWPHKSTFSSTMKYDNMKFDMYACSTEMDGREGSNDIAGAGVMCHEFSHVLGLPDLYDTDYSTNGQSHDPGQWDIMSGGSYNNYSRSPVGYTIYERYALGWSKPTIINAAGHYTLDAVNLNGNGYIIKSPTTGEFFMLDNRQKTGWDAYCPGHGLEVVRVDSTYAYAWEYNKINITASRNYYEMLRANNSNEGTDDGTADVYPGTNGVVRLTTTTTPSLTTYAGLNTDWALHNITETAGGTIEFDIVPYDIEEKTLVEDFESMEAKTAVKSTGNEGTIATWSCTNAFPTSPDAAYCNGSNAMALFKPGLILMTTDVEQDSIYLVTATICNPQKDAKYKLYYATGGTTSFQVVSNDPVVVPTGVNKYVAQWAVSIKGKARFRLNMTDGASTKTAPTYIDDFTIYYTDIEEPTTLLGDVNLDGKVDAADIACVVKIITGVESAGTYGTRDDVNTDGSVNSGDVSKLVTIIAGE